PLSFPLNCRLARNAQGIITHSEWARAKFSNIAPGVPVRQIPHLVRVPQNNSRNNATGRIELASFGLITPAKGIEQTLRALSVLRNEFDFHYTLVGMENSYFDVREIIASYDLADRVSITGRVTLEEFDRRIAETDIALNLRERTVGEASGSLCRIMAAGVASVVADVGWFAELPDSAVVKISVDEHADALLLAY